MVDTKCLTKINHFTNVKPFSKLVSNTSTCFFSDCLPAGVDLRPGIRSRPKSRTRSLESRVQKQHKQIAAACQRQKGIDPKNCSSSLLNLFH